MIMTRKETKLKNYCGHVLKAMYHYPIEGNADEARLSFRKSGEAYMKYMLYDALGEKSVTNYLNGSADLKGNPITAHRRPGYLLLHKDLKNKVGLSDAEDKALDDLSAYANVGAHDSDEETAVPDCVELDMLRAQSQLLTSCLYRKMGMPVPEELDDAYRGKVTETVLRDYVDFGDVLEVCDGFDKGNRYILVSPADCGMTSVSQKRLLSRIPWSFILDFDASTKGKQGLFTAFDGEGDSRIVPMTIEQYKSSTLAVSNSKGRLNWIFANGLENMAETVTSDFRSWIAHKYDKFIKKALRDFARDTVNTYYIVCLSGNIQYVKSIVNALHDIDELQPDLVHFVLVSADDDTLAALADEVEGYGFASHSVNMDANLFLLGIEESLSSGGKHGRSSVVVPAKADDGSMSTVDIAPVAPRLLDGGIEVVHSAVGEGSETGKSPAETFFRGEPITWHELSQEVEANRKVYEQVERKVKKKLAARQSSIFRLYHAAGAGGSTLSLQLAYALRKIYPVILLRRYVRDKTEETLQMLYNKVKTPVLVIVEASEVNVTTVDSLIRGCNSCKQNFLFLFVQRNSRKNPSDDTEYLSDSMLDLDEKNRFLCKVESYGKSRRLSDDLRLRTAKDCEVIDFSIAISENGYEARKIRDYVKYYTNLLSAPLNEFVLYVCMIYHYSQKPVSDLVFRSLFVKNGRTVGLPDYLRQRDANERMALRKLLVAIEGDGESDKGWRPRYASFGKAVLDTV